MSIDTLLDIGTFEVSVTLTAEETSTNGYTLKVHGFLVASQSFHLTPTQLDYMYEQFEDDILDAAQDAWEGRHDVRT